MSNILSDLFLAMIYGLMEYVKDVLLKIVSLALYAEKNIATLSGTNLIKTMTDVMFSFGVSVIILKFLKKGFETYVLWTEGDADEEPLSLLTNFFKAMAVAISFPTLYGWMAEIVENLTAKMMNAISGTVGGNFDLLLSTISSQGLIPVLLTLIFFIVYLMLYFQFLMRGLEIMILRVGVPLACVGLLDNDKGVFKAYSNKFFQSLLAILVQICLAKLGIGLMVSMNIIWGLACMILAVKTPKFLNEFIITTGSGSAGAINNVYHTVKLVGLAKSAITK